MRISICNENSKSTKLTTWEGTFPEFAQNLKIPVVGEKDGEYFIRGEAEVRNDHSLKSSEFIIIDCDASIDPSTGKTIKKGAPNYTGCPDLNKITEILKDAGLEFLIYSSHSYSATVNKCRVILPFVCKTPEALRDAVDYIIDLIRRTGALLADANENYAWSQPWFAARIATTDSPFYYHYNHGRPIEAAEIDAFIAERSISLTNPVPPVTKHSKLAPSKQQQPPSELDDFNALVTLENYDELLISHGYAHNHDSEFNGSNSRHYIRPGSTSGSAGVHVFNHETTASICHKTHHGSDDALHRSNGGFGFYADAVSCLEHQGELTYPEKLQLMQTLFGDVNVSILDQGIKAVSTDIGAVYENEFIDALIALQATSPADHARTVQKITIANKNVTKTDIEKACKKRSVKDDSSETSNIIELLGKTTSVFHDSERNGYAEIQVDNHTEIMLINSDDFEYYIRKVYHSETSGILKSLTLKDVQDTVNGTAIIASEERPIARRCALVNDKYIIDIGNERWQVIEVSSEGWKILDKSPIAFIRSKTMLALPIPDRDGADLSLLLNNANIPEKQFPLVAAALLDTFRADTAYPVLSICGDQGSAKSSTQNTMKLITDPSTSSLRTQPKNTEDFVVACAHSHVVAFDNLSYLSKDMHDLMCVASTGGAFSNRKLYSNMGENIVHLKSPIIISGITDLITRADLADRTVKINLPTIPMHKRKDENEVAKQFKIDGPKIMGGLLNLLSETLEKIPTTHVSKKPRMASYAVLGVAMVETNTFKKLNIPCDFLGLYEENRQLSIDDAIESSPAAVLLLQLLPTLNNQYYGTFKGLFERLSLIKGSTSGFPKSYKALSNELRRLETPLNSMGVTIEREEKARKDGKHVRITYIPTANNNMFSANNVHHVHQNSEGDDGELHIAKLIPDTSKLTGDNEKLFGCTSKATTLPKPLNPWDNDPTITDPFAELTKPNPFDEK